MTKHKGRKTRRHLKGRNLHHLIPRSRGGSSNTSNLLLLDIQFHRDWHYVFGNRTLDEVIALLQRIKRAKEAQKDV